jgi:hypothetical protein
MISVVFNGNAAYLLDDWPMWDTDFVLDATISAVTERGLSGRETRRVTGDTLRLEAKFTCWLSNAIAVTNLRNSLQGLNAQQVLCPLWPAGFNAGVTPPMTASFYATFNADFSFNSIQPAAALPFALFAVPLMVGYLKEIPNASLLTDAEGKISFHFVDADIYPLAPQAYAPPAGLTATGGAGLRPLFPFAPDWSTVPQSGESDVDVDRRQIGQLRTLASAYYAQRNRRKVTQHFRLQNLDPFNLLAFFVAMGGEQNNFWLGAALSEAGLTANVAATDTALHVDNGANIGTNSFVLLNDNNNRVPLVVSSVVGNTWNLSAAPGTAFGKQTTRIESLVLARFDDLKLTLNFTRPDLAHCTLKFCELPWETNAVAGETYGTTMGALPTTAILFVFTLTTPSGTTTWYFTNFERNLVDAGANTYLSVPMEFDAITETAVLDRQSLKLTARNFANNPLSLLVPFQLEWPLMVKIIEADVTAPNTAGNFRTYFFGEVGKANVEPPFIDADCMSLNHIFDRQLPRRLYVRTDNWVLFEGANGLVPANWKWSGQVVSYNAANSTLVVSTITSTNGAALTANWFTAGYCVITTGGVLQARMIGSNTAPAGGSMTIYLSSPLFTVPNAGDTIQMYAGYDMQSATAINKFNNYANFGGFPFIPIGNPTVLRIQQPSGSGKK